MSKVEQLHAELCDKLSEIETVCAFYKYEVIPTLLLRHAKGPSHSILLSNDSPSLVVLCIAELGNVGEVADEGDESEDTTTEVCPPTCITDQRSHFDWLVKFIEDVRQDSLRGDGLASEASSEVCRVILEHAEFIRKQGN